MKKILKITGIVLLILVLFLIATPFLFKGTIEKQVKKAINNNVNATVEWSDLNLSLFSSFPDARIKLKNISVVNKGEFEGDTLVAAKTIFLDMGIPQLWKSEDKPLSINELGLEKALVNVIINEEGLANYDIAIAEEKEEEEKEEEEGISLDVKHYEIKNSEINYSDESSKMFLNLKEFNHQGTGDFSAETSTLRTKTNGLISFKMDDSQYFENTALDLKADIKMDLKNMKFTFEENKALINQLALTFDGFVEIEEDHQNLDLSFTTPTSDFKNFLGVIPKEYLAELDNVETSGEFGIDGRIYGKNDEKYIPKLAISILSKNAYFKFPDLPKAVENINFQANLINETGLMKDMNLNLSNLVFTIDQDQFSAKGNFKNLMENTLVDLSVKGRLNLANINQAYPLEMDLDLDGILDADLTASFAMDDIEKENYEKVKSSGSASLSNFNYASEEMANPVKISKAVLKFNPANVDLQEFSMQTGETDAQLNGKLQNLMGYLFKDQPIKGNFNLKSNTFSVNDFMVADSSEEKEEQKSSEKTQKVEEAIKIPSFLDVSLNFTADKILYDNLILTNGKGALAIKDEKASLQNISADIFGGNIGLNGSVSTKTEIPKFDVEVSLNKIGISESLKEMELLKSLAPIAQAFVGDLTTKINLNGDLTKDLSPIYSSLTGSGLAEILNANIEKSNLSFVYKLDEKLDFINLDEVKLKDLTTHFSFKDGGVDFEPFHFNLHKNIKAEIKGRHTFDNELDYKMDLDIPAKYLGGEISKQLAKLTESEVEDMHVDLPISFSGGIKNPKINVDIKSATKALTNEIVEKQKGKVKDKAKDKAKDLLDGFLKDDDKEEEEKAEQKSDSLESEEDKKEEKSKKDKAKDKAKDALKDIFGNKNKK